MRTKLTVTIDPAVLPRAKRAARAKGVSLSSIIEASLRQLGQESRPSFAARWRGRLKVTRRTGARYHQLANKYL